MQITKKRSFVARLRGFFLLGHPVPVLFHLIAVTVFALLAAWPHVVWGLLGALVGAHTLMQLAIAVFNDYFDRARDALGKPTKPIPSGLVTAREAFFFGWVLLALMVVLLLPLPPLAWLFTLGYLTLGMAYNLGLKATPLSGVVFALAMPLIPLYAFAGMGRELSALVWLLPMGVLLGVALNLANALPDLEEDAGSGARTLAVALGLRRSFVLGDALLALDALLLLVLHLTGAQRMQPLVLGMTLTLSALLLLLLLIFTGAGKARSRRKLYFYLVTLTCLVLAGGWLIGVLI
ncbi:MAG TPA: UbiA family prenyltransferase [Ktedonobacteraceae bacterium]|jgi:4-hydroxybenzoate polyprenyltransferase